jgi:hypothetical protein
LNTQESRHALARRIFHGRRGELRQAYREGQEDQLGAIGLVLNTVGLWNTRYLDRALTNMTDAGIDSADLIWLSPLGSEHINIVGRYHFQTATVSRLRPLAVSNVQSCTDPPATPTCPIRRLP